MGEPQRGGRPGHAHTAPNIRCSTSVQRRPVVSPLASVSHLPCHIICPTPHTPTPYSFLVRVEVCRDRHAQKAGCGSRAVAIDSAAVTQAQIPMRTPPLCVCPSFCIVDSLLHVGRCSQDWLTKAPRVPLGRVATREPVGAPMQISIIPVNDDSVRPVAHGEVILARREVVDPNAVVSDLDVAR